MYGGTKEENKEIALEDIALQVDRLENILIAMSMPIDNKIHVEAIKDSLPDIKAKLKRAYFELGGEDVWSI